MIRIVVVDDHEMVREGLKSILQTESDFEVVGELASAEGLLELVERTHPDVVLLDARLPGQSGPEACRDLKQTYPDVRVLVVSTFSDDDLVDASMKAGADGYVIKDIERFELRQSIRAVSRGETVIDGAIAGLLLHRLRSGDGEGSASRAPLNPGQLQILALISEGFSNREIAARVHLSENTVKTHIREIFRKLDVDSRVEAALRGTREGWI
jgi:DNA-binding NarL/FixJ family response regulator